MTSAQATRLIRTHESTISDIQDRIREMEADAELLANRINREKTMLAAARNQRNAAHKTIGAAARDLRVHARLKQKTVATALGISTSQLSKLENGEARWTEDLFTRILHLQ